MRFDYVYTADDGVRVRGLAAAAVLEGELHLIFYEGTALRFFEKERDEVERILTSIRPR